MYGLFEKFKVFVQYWTEIISKVFLFLLICILAQKTFAFKTKSSISMFMHHRHLTLRLIQIVSFNTENMLETLQGPVLSDNPSLVSCLRLQHEHHLRQVKVLQGKQLRQSNIEARKGRPVKMRSKSIQTESLNSLPHRATGVRHQNVLVNTQVGWWLTLCDCMCLHD